MILLTPEADLEGYFMPINKYCNAYYYNKCNIESYFDKRHFYSGNIVFIVGVRLIS